LILSSIKMIYLKYLKVIPNINILFISLQESSFHTYLGRIIFKTLWFALGMHYEKNVQRIVMDIFKFNIIWGVSLRISAQTKSYYLLLSWTFAARKPVPSQIAPFMS